MFKLDVGEVEQWGDDQYIQSWRHSQKGTITVKGNKLSVDVLEALSGNAASSPDTNVTMYIGTDVELVPPRVMVRAKTTMRLDDGSLGYTYVYFFNCDVKTVWESGLGGERAKLAEVQLSFTVYASETDEVGEAIDPTYAWAFGRYEIAPNP